MALLGWRRFVPALGARASDRVSLLKSWRAGGALIRTYSSINSRTLVVTRHNPQLVPVATLGCAQQINEVTAAHLPIHGAQIPRYSVDALAPIEGPLASLCRTPVEVTTPRYRRPQRHARRLAQRTLSHPHQLSGRPG